MKFEVKLWVRAAVLAATILVSAGLGAAQEVKIAVVDLQRLTVGTEEGKKNLEKLDKRYQEIAGIMQKAQKDIEDKQKRLTEGARLLSDSVKAQLAKDIEKDSTDLKRKNEDYQQELAELENELMAPLMGQAEAVLSVYVKEKGYSFLFNLSAENGNVVWFNRGNDITDDVIKAIDSQAKAASNTPAP